MATITISLPDQLKDFVELEVSRKGYGNVSEYFRSLLRQAQEQESDARLKALLLEGLTSGDARIVDKGFWSELKDEAVDLLERRGQKKRDKKTGS
jgi:antitoxin ParD1/3/4